jgi:hypothetical protein
LRAVDGEVGHVLLHNVTVSWSTRA